MAIEAAAQIARAVADLKNVEAPLAEWRVFATAAEVAGRRGDASEAASWRVHALFPWSEWPDPRTAQNSWAERCFP